MSTVLTHSQETLFFSFTPDHAYASISPKEFSFLRPNNSSALLTPENNKGPSLFHGRTFHTQKTLSVRSVAKPTPFLFQNSKPPHMWEVAPTIKESTAKQYANGSETLHPHTLTNVLP
ncbi:hypothetical protein TNCV_2966691 [Trichonephila clavipes]|nr:hypothetical protein TNCV_2966691 [Trichonephila clavipes]